ncbi:hypothetical protein SARC_09555, partial [Sphaeroforma arctica JP610]
FTALQTKYGTTQEAYDALKVECGASQTTYMSQISNLTSTREGLDIRLAAYIEAMKLQLDEKKLAAKALSATTERVKNLESNFRVCNALRVSVGDGSAVTTLWRTSGGRSEAGGFEVDELSFIRGAAVMHRERLPCFTLCNSSVSFYTCTFFAEEWHLAAARAEVQAFGKPAGNFTR